MADGLRRIGLHRFSFKKEIGILGIENGHMPMIDLMGIEDDHALFILTKNIGKANAWHNLA